MSRVLKWIERIARSSRRRATRRVLAACGAIVALAAVARVVGLVRDELRAGRTRTISVHAPEAIGVELLDPADSRRVLAAWTLPQREPVAVEAGRYDLRIVGRGRMGERRTIDLETQDARLRATLDVRRYAEPLLGAWHVAPVDLGAARGLVAFDERGVRLLDGVRTNGRLRELWRRDFDGAVADAVGPGFRWATWRARLAQVAWFGGDGAAFAPACVERFVDLDRDGVGDVVFAGRHQAWVLALSGASGRLLWCGARGADVGSADAGADALPPLASTIDEAPEVGPDVDGDGVPELLVARREAGDAGDPSSIRVTMDVLSGATGDSLRPRDLLPGELRSNARASDSEPAFDPIGDWRGSSYLGADPVSPLSPLGPLERGGPARFRWLRAGDAWRAGVIIDAHLAASDPRDAASVETVELLGTGRTSFTEAVPADVDGDGHDELVTLEFLGLGGSGQAMVADAAWRLSVRNRNRPAAGWTRAWGDGRGPGGQRIVAPRPLIVDLDHDGVLEIVTYVPRQDDANPEAGVVGSRVSTWNGATGEPRWETTVVRSPPPASRYDACHAGPDLDGDGCDELYVVSLETGRPRVQALSGRDGREFWRVDVSDSRIFSELVADLHEIFWRKAGADGWPRLVVGYSVQRSSGTSRVAISAGTGRIDERGEQIARAVAVDLDGDGVDELLTTDESLAEATAGRWEIQRGLSGLETRLENAGESLGDLDGDGEPERIRFQRNATTVYDGRTGTALWRRARPGGASPAGRSLHYFTPGGVPETPEGVPETPEWSFLPPSPRRERGDRLDWGPFGASGRDLDGDGVPEVLHAPTYGPAAVLSGRTGRLLGAFDASEGASVDWGDFDRDGFVDRLSRAWSSDDPFAGSQASVLISGRTGREAWRFESEAPVPPIPADVDGDGVADLVLVASERAPRLRALEASTGRELWSLHAASSDADDSLGAVATGTLVDAVVLRDAGGKESPTLLVLLAADSPNNAVVRKCRVAGLDPRTGERRWERASVGPGAADPPPLRVLRRGGTPSRAAYYVWHARRIHIFDAAGRETTRELRAGPESSTAAESWTDDDRDAGVWMFVCDADADGTDELCWTKDGKCMVVAPDADAPVWRRQLPLGVGAVWGRRLGANGVGEVLVGRRDLARIEAWSVRDGRTTWTCPWPAGEFDFSRAPARRPWMTLRVPRGDEAAVWGAAPRVEFRIDLYGRELVRVHAATRAPDELVGRTPADRRLESRATDPRMLGTAWRAWGVERAPPVLRSGRDPRWARPLPWVPAPWFAEYEPADSRNAFRPTAFAAPAARRLLLSTALVVGPLAYVAFAARRRRFSLRQLLLLPLLVGLFLTYALRAERPFDDTPWFDGLLRSDDFLEAFGGLAWFWTAPWMLAVRYAAPTAWTGAALAAAWRGRWRSLAAGVGVLVLGTIAVAVWHVAVDAYARPLDEFEYYGAKGWALVLPDGVFATAWIAAVLAPFGGLLALARKRWRSFRVGRVAGQSPPGEGVE